MLPAFVCFDPSLFSAYLIFLIFSFELSCDCCHGNFAAANDFKGSTKGGGTLSIVQVPRLPRQSLQGRRCMDEEASWWQDIRMIGNDLLHIQNYTNIFKRYSHIFKIIQKWCRSDIIISWSQLFLPELLVSMPCPCHWVACKRFKRRSFEWLKPIVGGRHHGDRQIRGRFSDCLAQSGVWKLHKITPFG